MRVSFEQARSKQGQHKRSCRRPSIYLPAPGLTTTMADEVRLTASLMFRAPGAPAMAPAPPIKPPEAAVAVASVAAVGCTAAVGPREEPAGDVIVVVAASGGAVRGADSDARTGCMARGAGGGEATEATAEAEAATPEPALAVLPPSPLPVLAVPAAELRPEPAPAPAPASLATRACTTGLTELDERPLGGLAMAAGTGVGDPSGDTESCVRALGPGTRPNAEPEETKAVGRGGAADDEEDPSRSALLSRLGRLAAEEEEDDEASLRLLSNLSSPRPPSSGLSSSSSRLRFRDTPLSSAATEEEEPAPVARLFSILGLLERRDARLASLSERSLSR